MAGNRISRQIDWDQDQRLLEAWENAETGYPWIDACMTQVDLWWRAKDGKVLLRGCAVAADGRLDPPLGTARSGLLSHTGRPIPVLGGRGKDL